MNEDDELALLTTNNETTTTAATTAKDELEMTTFRITDGTENHVDTSPKETSGEENNENCNTENVDKIDEAPRRRRKLSPIVYNRSHSPSPIQLKSSVSLVPTLAAKRMYQNFFLTRLFLNISFFNSSINQLLN